MWRVKKRGLGRGWKCKLIAHSTGYTPPQTLALPLHHKISDWTNAQIPSALTAKTENLWDRKIWRNWPNSQLLLQSPPLHSNTQSPLPSYKTVVSAWTSERTGLSQQSLILLSSAQHRSFSLNDQISELSPCFPPSCYSCFSSVCPSIPQLSPIGRVD